jgi:hypothetical protein
MQKKSAFSAARISWGLVLTLGWAFMNPASAADCQLRVSQAQHDALLSHLRSLSEPLPSGAPEQLVSLRRELDGLGLGNVLEQVQSSSAGEVRDHYLPGGVLNSQALVRLRRGIAQYRSRLRLLSAATGSLRNEQLARADSLLRSSWPIFEQYNAMPECRASRTAAPRATSSAEAAQEEAEASASQSSSAGSGLSTCDASRLMGLVVESSPHQLLTGFRSGLMEFRRPGNILEREISSMEQDPRYSSSLSDYRRLRSQSDSSAAIRTEIGRVSQWLDSDTQELCGALALRYAPRSAGGAPRGPSLSQCRSAIRRGRAEFSRWLYEGHLEVRLPEAQQDRLLGRIQANHFKRLYLNRISIAERLERISQDVLPGDYPAEFNSASSGQVSRQDLERAHHRYQTAFSRLEQAYQDIRNDTGIASAAEDLNRRAVEPLRNISEAATSDLSRCRPDGEASPASSGSGSAERAGAAQ